MLGAIDFWFDNLRANGADPAFIDFETALQPATLSPEAIGASGADVFRAYVLSGLSVGILSAQFPVGEGKDPTEIGCVAPADLIASTSARAQATTSSLAAGPP